MEVKPGELVGIWHDREMGIASSDSVCQQVALVIRATGVADDYGCKTWQILCEDGELEIWWDHDLYPVGKAKPKRFRFPKIRKIQPKLSAPDIIKEKPMTLNNHSIIKFLYLDKD